MSGWDTVELGSAAQVFNGKTPSKTEQREAGHPVLKIRDVSELGRFRGPFQSFVDESLAERYASKTVRQGDTLILNAAHNADYVGSKTFHAELAVYGALATGEWLIIRPASETLDAGFVHHWVRLGSTRRQIKEVVNGIHLYPKDVGRLKIPLPPLPEQRRIAAILDQADALRAKRREALAQLDSLSQSIFIEMFGDQQSQEWPIETIADVAARHDGAIRTGPFGSQLLHSEFEAEGIAVLGIDNAVANEFRWGERRFISEAKYRELRRYTVSPGDVLITIMGTCGRCAIVPDDIPVSINTKHLCCITLNVNKCRPEYLHAFFLRHPLARAYLAQTSKGAIMSGLNMGLIKSMPICVPPLPLQQRFATRIQAVAALKATHSAALVELDALFASVQHRAFAGQLK